MDADRARIAAWGYSSAGRALDWQSRGQRFDPAYLHQKANHKAWPCGLLFAREQRSGYLLYEQRAKRSVRPRGSAGGFSVSRRNGCGCHICLLWAMFFSGLGNRFRRPFGYDVIIPNGKGPPPCRRLETYVRNVELIIMLETSPAGMGIFVSGTTRMAAFLEPVLLG